MVIAIHTDFVENLRQERFRIEKPVHSLASFRCRAKQLVGIDVLL